jgi:hypothetical protein
LTHLEPNHHHHDPASNKEIQNWVVHRREEYIKLKLFFLGILPSDIVKLCMAYVLQLENWQIKISTRTSTRGFTHVVSPDKIIFPIAHDDFPFLTFYYDVVSKKIQATAIDNDILTWQACDITIPRIDRPMDWYDRQENGSDLQIRFQFLINGTLYNGNSFSVNSSPASPTYDIQAMKNIDLTPDLQDNIHSTRTMKKYKTIGKLHCHLLENGHEVIDKIEFYLNEFEFTDLPPFFQGNNRWMKEKNF